MNTVANREAPAFDSALWDVPEFPPERCPIRTTLVALADDKWKIPVVMRLGRYERLRFRELLRSLPNVRPKALTKALRSLEEHGLIVREAFGEVPARVEYSLASATLELLPLLFDLQRWALERDMPASRLVAAGAAASSEGVSER